MIDHAEQTRRWLAGDPVHVDGDDGGTCCPDFSCCVPELLAPFEERELFARECERLDEPPMRLLTMFLKRAIAREFPEMNVYVAGTTGDG